MALPGPGNPLSINQIRTELGSSSGSLRALSALAGKSTPDAMSEFYGYSSVSYNYYGTYLTDPCGVQRDIYRRTSDDVFFWYDGSNYNYIGGTYYYTYEYYDYWEMWYVYTIWYIGGSSLYVAGSTQSWCAPY